RTTPRGSSAWHSGWESRPRTPCSASCLDWSIRNHRRMSENLAFVAEFAVDRVRGDPKARKVWSGSALTLCARMPQCHREVTPGRVRHVDLLNPTVVRVFRSVASRRSLPHLRG